MASIGGFFHAHIVGTVMVAPKIGRITEGPPKFASVTLTISRWKHDKATKKSIRETEWIACVFFGQRAQVVRDYVTKGTRLFCAGRLSSCRFTDKEGVRHAAYRLIVDEFQMLDRKEFPAHMTGAAEVASAEDNRKSRRNPRYGGAFS